MTKNRCKMCELMTEARSSSGVRHGSSELHHPTSLDRPNHPAIGGQPLGAATINYPTNLNYLDHGLLSGFYLPQLLKDTMLPAYLLRGYYQPAGPLIQHPSMLPPVKAQPPEPTPTPPHNSEGSDDLVATSTTSGGTNTSTGGGGGFYRAYCPQYYGTPPQYQELCYPPSYPHPHSHPPPYYKYAPTYRRQYYGYPGGEGGGGTAGGGGGGGGGAGGGGGGAGPGVVEYQPPQPGEYPMLPYYGAYPPPPPPLPPPPNPAYLHAQGRAIVDHAAFQGCPCPMQSCPKNVDTGPLIGNGKGAPVASGPGLSLPPSALVGPPSPARGLAGLAPPHGANAWDTDRVQLNTRRGGGGGGGGGGSGNLDSQARQRHSIPASASVHGIVPDIHPRGHLSDSRTTNEVTRADDKLAKCTCQKRACTSRCEVKLEAPSSIETPSSAMTSAVVAPSTTSACGKEKSTLQDFKLENNNVKCESCSVGIPRENISCSANCNVKCETGYNCEIIKCEECMKEGEMRMMELEKESGMRLMDEKRLEIDSSVKEELNDSILVDVQNWRKPDYEPIVQDNPEDRISESSANVTPSHRNDNDDDDDDNDDDDDDDDEDEDEDNDDDDDNLPNCRRLVKRKLSLDSLSEVAKKLQVDKRTLSLGSTRKDCPESDVESLAPRIVVHGETLAGFMGASKKSFKKDTQKRKSNETMSCEIGAKRAKVTKSPTTTTTTSMSNGLKSTATESSINETIDDVIQQSLKMSEKKNVVGEEKVERRETGEIFVKKKEGNVLSTVKRGSRKFDSVRVAIGEKSSLVKGSNEAKVIAKEARCKIDNKLGGFKSQDVRCKRPKMTADMRHKSAESSKPKVLPDTRAKESTRKAEIGGSLNLASGKNRLIENSDSVKRAGLVKKKRKSTKTSYAKRVVTSGNAIGKQETSGGETLIDNCSLAKRSLLKPKWSNGWSWEGHSYEAKVYLTNEKSAIRRCYASMKHASGDVLRPRDCVLLKSGQRKADLPFVAKIAALWENPDDGEMMFSLLWYYRPEHTEQGRTDYDTEDEVFASRHRDANSVACIEDKCYILTFNEYCRYRKNLRRIDEGLESPGLIVPPGEQTYPRESRQPPIPVSADMVLFCRRVYDYRGKKLVKNPG